MKTTVAFLRPFEGLEYLLSLVEVTFLDRLINTDYVLPYYATSANVEMTAENAH